MKNRRLAIIFAVVLVDMLSFSIVLPLLPYLADRFGATPFQIGLLNAVYPLAQVIAAPVLGRLSDRFGRKPVLLLSIAGTVLGFIVLATARSLWILFFSRALDGITGGNISVAQAYIADITDEKDRGRALGLIGAAFGIGFIAGPLTGAALSGLGATAPAWAGAILATINLALVAFALPESLTEEDKKRLAARPHKGLDWRAARAALHHHRVGPLLGVKTLTGLSFALFESGFALWGIAALQFTLRTNSLILAYVGVLSVFVQAFLIGQLTKRFADDHLLHWSLWIAAASLTLWGFVTSLWMLIVLMPFLSIGLAVSNTIQTSALTKSVTHDEVGGILGVNTSIQSFTRIPAAVAAGALLQYVSTWSLGVTAGVLAACAALLVFGTMCVRPGRRACDEELKTAAAS